MTLPRTTRAAVLWDDENLYFAARLQEENVWGTIVQRDAVIYHDNDFEIFLDVDACGSNYYELELNPLEEPTRAGPLLPPLPPERLEEEMVHIPACRFTLGPDPSDAACSPAHEVCLDGYWIDPYRVTVAQFTAFLNGGDHDEHYFEFMANPHECGIIGEGDGPYRVVEGRARHAAVYVSHHAAAAYAEWSGKQLPTEAQWERTARGGVSSAWDFAACGRSERFRKQRGGATTEPRGREFA